MPSITQERVRRAKDYEGRAAWHAQYRTLTDKWATVRNADNRPKEYQ
jgi:hypothetical protein